MARVEYQFPVDVVHGKISKKHKVGFAHRKASKLNYTQGYGERTTPVSAAEINHRNKFKAVQALARARMKDPERGPMDMVQWKLDNKGYTTFYGYCFHLEWEAYSED